MRHRDAIRIIDLETRVAHGAEDTRRAHADARRCTQAEADASTRAADATRALDAARQELARERRLLSKW